MYKMNLFLKLIITMLTIITIVLTNNNIILWLLLLVITFNDVRKNNNAGLLIDFILIVLLFLINKSTNVIFLFKIIMILKLLVLLFFTFDRKEKEYLKNVFNSKDKVSERDKFYNLYKDRIFNDNYLKSKKIYLNDTVNDDKIISDLDNLYLESKIRFNGYFVNKRTSFEWNKIDIMILFLSIILFIIAFILR